jgi:hypothetical protein
MDTLLDLIQTAKFIFKENKLSEVNRTVSLFLEIVTKATKDINLSKVNFFLQTLIHADSSSNPELSMLQNFFKLLLLPDPDINKTFFKLLELSLKQLQQQNQGVNQTSVCIYLLMIEYASLTNKSIEKSIANDPHFFKKAASLYKQSEYGKCPKQSSKFFLRRLIEQNVSYWVDDRINCVRYFTAQEKKKYKVRKDAQTGVLKRAVDEKMLADGDYLYIISPKGSLYAINNEELPGNKLHHSTLRSGQLLICAGKLSVFNGKIIKINNSSGHYTPSYEQLIFGALRLHAQEILEPECMVEEFGLKILRLAMILEQDEFKVFRGEAQAYRLNASL